MPARPLGGRPRAGGSVILKLPPARGRPRRGGIRPRPLGLGPGHWAVHWQCTAHRRGKPEPPAHRAWPHGNCARALSLRLAVEVNGNLTRCEWRFS